LETAGKFATIAALGLALNAAIMAAGTIGLGLHYLLVQVAATAIVLLWNFSGNYLWSFREGGPRDN
jgi:putative flippase GtrA